MKIFRNLFAVMKFMVLFISFSQANDSTEQSSKLVTTNSGIDNSAIVQSLNKIDGDGFMQHVNVLASDEFEGRAPSTDGGRKTVGYLENAFKKIGLEPVFGSLKSKSYRQPVKLIEQTVTNHPPLTISYRNGQSDSFEYRKNVILWSPRIQAATSIENSELIFVGYGIVAPEYNWNDYAGVDVNGKTVVILVNDPGLRSPDGELFNGKAMTYYGRWTYKFEEASRQGAKAAILVHENHAAGYDWRLVINTWSGPQYMLDWEDNNYPAVTVQAWISQSAAQQLFANCGFDYQQMVAKASEIGFKGVSLNANATTTLQNINHKSISYNVAGVIIGRERLEEVFVYVAHWDHLGIKPDDDAEDVIYNGAQDNATGVAGILEIAQAFKALPQAPKRSVVFLAVTAEESGLLGSAQYVADPPFPMENTVAGINIDGMATYGQTVDTFVVGYGQSEMDQYLEKVAKPQGRVVLGDPTPEYGYFYRSDHLNFIKKGVPMLFAESGIIVRNKPDGYGRRESYRYYVERYHQSTDEVHAEWDNGGIMQELEAYFRIGLMISDGDSWPKWSVDSEFRTAREASQKWLQ